MTWPKHKPREKTYLKGGWVPPRIQQGLDLHPLELDVGSLDAGTRHHSSQCLRPTSCGTGSLQWV